MTVYFCTVRIRAKASEINIIIIRVANVPE